MCIRDSYQYYGAAGDGKRAEGFRSIEGISGIHAADEVYTFYFKAGKPYVSDKKGNSLFTINAKKYAFSDLGIMQTGRQIANVANDEIANFYFGEDGIVKLSLIHISRQQFRKKVQQIGARRTAERNWKSATMEITQSPVT